MGTPLGILRNAEHLSINGRHLKWILLLEYKLHTTVGFIIFHISLFILFRIICYNTSSHNQLCELSTVLERILEKNELQVVCVSALLHLRPDQLFKPDLPVDPCAFCPG